MDTIFVIFHYFMQLMSLLESSTRNYSKKRELMVIPNAKFKQAKI